MLAAAYLLAILNIAGVLPGMGWLGLAALATVLVVVAGYVRE